MTRLDRVLVSCLAPALVLAAGCGNVLESDGAAGAREVSVAAVRADLEISVPAKGYLEALQASPVAVPRVPTGALKVKELADEGTIIEAGQIVVVFDDTELNIELDNHRASFRSANRRIDQTQLQSDIVSGSLDVMRQVAELERDNAEAFHIVDETIYSRQDILETEVRKDDAEATIVFADASLLLRGEYYDIEERILGVEKEQVEGKIGRVETSLGALVLKSPIAGLLVYKKNWRGSTVAVGDTLWPGNMILSIVDPASTALKAFLLEKDAAGVEVGSSARVVVDARPDREFEGRVKSVAEISRPIERGSPVKYTEVVIEVVDGDPGLLKPGMKGEARILIGLVENAVVIPRSSVRGDVENPYVLVSEGEAVTRRPVKLGRGDQVRVSVEEGLDGGERVVLGEEATEDRNDVARRPSASFGGAG